MVAPVTVEKSARYLVRIPKASPPATRRQALHTLRAGGKLPPAPVSTLTTPTCELPAPSPNASGNGSLLLPRGRRHSESSQGCAGLKRKVYEMEPQEDPNKERCRLNAINARRNRELKKAQMQELERRVEHVSKERDQLAGENESLREAKARLEHQVQHLNNILKNQSQLSALLSKVSPATTVLGTTGREDALTEEEAKNMSKGVCLHLDGAAATLEYCSSCARKAGKRLRLLSEK